MGEGKETQAPTPILSRKELRRQRKQSKEAEEIQRRNKEKRRLIFKGIGATILAAATGGIGWRIFNSGESPSKTEVQYKTPTWRLQPTPETLLPENQVIAQTLAHFNEEIAKNPNKFKELAPQIGLLAVQFFSKEMQYDTKNYENKIHFLEDSEFQKTLLERSDCIEMPGIESKIATTTLKTHEIFINLTSFPYQGRTTLQADNGYYLFGALIHELLHASAVDSLKDEGGQQQWFRGVTALIPDPGNSRSGKLCYGREIERQRLEEAIVQEATDKLTMRLGFTVRPSQEYEMWVYRYKTGVLERFFDGKNNIPLKLHQQTNPNELFRIIGEKLGSRPELQVSQGQQYVFGLLASPT